MLPQVFIHSPTIFAQVLGAHLNQLQLEKNTRILQYVDDILVAATEEQLCKKATWNLLNSLGRWGYKASPTKLQYCEKEVRYLGHVLSKGKKRLAESRIKVIEELIVPTTKKALIGYLDVVGYYRQWIPSFGEIAKPLYAKLAAEITEPLRWEKEEKKAFHDLKNAIKTSPALGLPNYEKPFCLFVHEQAGVASGVLTQKLGSSNRPIGYFSKQLDPVAKGLPSCLRAVAGTALLIGEAQKIVMGYPLTIKVPHEVNAILMQKAMKYLTPARHSYYEVTLLGNPDITMETCGTLNPATLLPIVEIEEKEHQCLEILEVLPIRKDLVDEKLENAEIEMFVDGSSFIVNGKRHTGFAVVTESNVLKAEPLPSVMSAQAAELVGLTEALKIAKGKTANIWTDSKYVFDICHATGKIWKERFLTASGKRVANGEQILDLIDAGQSPRKVAVIHCRGHQSGLDPIVKGNNNADRAAKNTATKAVIMATLEIPRCTLPEFKMDPREEEKFLVQGAIKADDKMTMPDGRIAFFKAMLRPMLKELHHTLHVGALAMAGIIKRLYYAPGIYAEVQWETAFCELCQRVTAKNNINISIGARPWAYVPFERLQVDYVDLPPVGRNKYLLMIVDQLSKWPEAFAVTKATALETAKIILQEIVPRFGPPRTIESDQGMHFTGAIVKHLTEAVGSQWKFHAPWHPQSSGQVEKMNCTLKKQITKICTETNVKWDRALPLALLRI